MGAQAVRLSNVDIDNALKNKDFEVLFQPIFDLGNGALARVETFVRWRHAGLGVLPPGAFISFFESQGRMSELTHYVLSEALSRYRAWRGPSAPGFSINLALSDLANDAFASHFLVLLRDSDFPADLITLECPMPPVTMETAAAAECFQRLSETGARLAIEVRGRANDFLRQIDPFPFDEIKTGGAAILRFARTVRGPGLSAISELLEIASNANAAITAVGVEDQASLAALRGLGFAAAQGNHLGKVGPLEAFSPSRVNEVRELLGLEPLSPQDLYALFRTEAPAVQSAPSAPHNPDAAQPREKKDALVERLAARLKRQTVIEGEAAEKSEAAAKAAAIARAKRKAAASAGTEKTSPMRAAAAPQSAPVGAKAKIAAARHLQERLSREFASRPSAVAPSPAAPSADALDEIDDHIDPSVEAPQTSANAGAPPPGQDNAMAEPLKIQIADERDDDSAPPAEERKTLAPDAAPSESEIVEPPAPIGDQANAVADANTRRDAPEEISGVTMAVENARAFFRPAMRVGAGALAPPPNEPPVMGTLAEDAVVSVVGDPPAAAPAEPAAPDEDEDIAIIGDDAPDAPTAEDAAPDAPPDPAPGSEAAPDSEATPDAAQGSPAEADEAAQEPSAPVAERPRRKKSFLKRTVIPFPTHFWPRSWTRARQRLAARGGRRDEKSDLEAAE